MYSVECREGVWVVLEGGEFFAWARDEADALDIIAEAQAVAESDRLMGG